MHRRNLILHDTFVRSWDLGSHTEHQSRLLKPHFRWESLRTYRILAGFWRWRWRVRRSSWLALSRVSVWAHLIPISRHPNLSQMYIVLDATLAARLTGAPLLAAIAAARRSRPAVLRKDLLGCTSLSQDLTRIEGPIVWIMCAGLFVADSPAQIS